MNYLSGFGAALFCHIFLNYNDEYSSKQIIGGDKDNSLKKTVRAIIATHKLKNMSIDTSNFNSKLDKFKYNNNIKNSELEFEILPKYKDREHEIKTLIKSYGITRNTAIIYLAQALKEINEEEKQKDVNKTRQLLKQKIIQKAKQFQIERDENVIKLYWMRHARQHRNGINIMYPGGYPPTTNKQLREEVETLIPKTFKKKDWDIKLMKAIQIVEQKYTDLKNKIQSIISDNPKINKLKEATKSTLSKKMESRLTEPWFTQAIRSYWCKQYDEYREGIEQLKLKIKLYNEDDNETINIVDSLGGIDVIHQDLKRFNRLLKDKKKFDNC